ncbi:MAG: putative SprT family Zn-dependent metalloprotease [Colwellia sp.]|jgi:predicted SprT family Zn-dependent metalloprotease
MITIEIIKKTYEECLSVAIAKAPLTSWKQQPIGVGFTTHKVKYGLATPSGEILLNPSFIGTKAVNKLKETIFHEFAHFCVGREKNHTAPFKRALSYFSEGLTVPVEENQMVKANNGYKYRILGFSKTKTYNLEGAFKRTKKYLDYDPKGKRAMRILGDLFLRFEYVPYDDPLPKDTISYP